jgi:ATP-dependent RNA helicase RhlE
LTTPHDADALADKLDKAGISAAALHGNKSQNARTRALAAFKSLKLHALVATDIAARGIDIDQLPYVVNYELPNVPEDYVHRIGRTGRAGSTGQAVSLVCVDEHKLLWDIERLLKREIEVKAVPGFEVDKSIKAEPIQNGRRGQQPRAAAPAKKAKPPQQQKPQKQQKQQQQSQQQPQQQRARQGAKPGVKSDGRLNGNTRGGRSQGQGKLLVKAG